MKRLLQMWPYMAILLVVCLFAPQKGFAQGGTIDGQTFGPTGAPKGGVAVTVCASTATVTNGVCAPAESDANCCFTDGTLSVRLATPAAPNQLATVVSDGLGNFTVWAAPGTYKVSYSGAGVGAQTVTKTVGCVPGNSATCGAFTNAPNTWSAPQTFMGPVLGNARANAFTPFDYGAKGNVVSLSTCGITATQAILTCPGASFTSGDATHPIYVTGAGASGNALVTTIASFTSSTQVTLSAVAGTTVANAITYYGTDDSAAIKSCIQNGTLAGGRCTINNGVTFMVSNAASTINFFSLSATPVPGGMIDGTGTIVFAPQGALTTGLNDRLFYIQSNSTGPFQINGAISKGATSFTAQNSGDAATLSPGQWLVILERDAGAGDNVIADWAQVSSVAGTTVNVLTPFRVAFPNLRTWTGGPNFYGTSFTPIVMSSLMQNITLKDFSIIVPAIHNGGFNVVGIVSHLTRGLTLSNLTVSNASQNGYGSYVDQGLILTDNKFINNSSTNAAIEVASTVDATMKGNTANAPGNGIFGVNSPQQVGVLIDFGTGFSTFNGNTIGDSLQEGLSLNIGVHDSVFSNNTVGWVKNSGGSSGIFTNGAYRNVVTGNTLAGGDGGSSGIRAGDTTTLTVNINTDANIFWNNSIGSSFSVPYNVSGSLGTDNFWDPISTVNLVINKNSNLQLKGGTSGVAQLSSPSVAGGVATLPNGTGNVVLDVLAQTLSGKIFSDTPRAKGFVSDQGSVCTIGELALSAGWQSTGSATVTAVAGNGQTCSWTITTGTTTAANPTVTDTLTNALPAATTVCEMNIHGGTHTAAAGEGFQQTTLSATAPIFTFNGTPTAGGTTYFVTRRCGP